MVGGPGGQHRLPLGEAAGVVGGGVDVDGQLGAAGGLGGDRPRRAPDVLADRDGHPDAVDDEEGAGVLARGEVAGLVEDAVVGQEPLAVQAPHAPAGADGGGVVEVALGQREADHGHRLAGAGGHLFQGPDKGTNAGRAQSTAAGGQGRGRIVARAVHQGTRHRPATEDVRLPFKAAR